MITKQNRNIASIVVVLMLAIMVMGVGCKADKLYDQESRNLARLFVAGDGSGNGGINYAGSAHVEDVASDIFDAAAAFDAANGGAGAHLAKENRDAFFEFLYERLYMKKDKDGYIEYRVDYDHLRESYNVNY